MTESTAVERPPAPDYETLTHDELIVWREAENRFRASDTARAMLGEPDPGATIKWERVALPGRELPVRVYRPVAGAAREASGTAPEGAPASETSSAAALPLVLHVHGGGFVGTAAQCDWANSHLAAHLPAVVVSVEHRLLDRDTPLAAAADDGWDTLQLVLHHAKQWGVDPSRIAVFGESCGALISALTAIRAARAGLELRAQVLVNPAVDVTGTMFDYPSMAQYADTATAGVPQLRLFQRLSAPPGTDPRDVSPLSADGLGGLAPSLVIVPTADPVADHGRRYAERLNAAGTATRLIEYPDAPHAFLTLPGLVPQAHPARTEILDFLRSAFLTFA